MRPGDLFFLYTDGVTEAEDPAARQFGEERLKSLLAKKGHGAAGRLRDEPLKAEDERAPSPPQREAGVVVELGSSLRKLSHRRLDPGDPLFRTGGRAQSPRVWRRSRLDP